MMSFCGLSFELFSDHYSQNKILPFSVQMYRSLVQMVLLSISGLLFSDSHQNSFFVAPVCTFGVETYQNDPNSHSCWTYCVSVQFYHIIMDKYVLENHQKITFLTKVLKNLKSLPSRRLSTPPTAA